MAKKSNRPIRKNSADVKVLDRPSTAEKKSRVEKVSRRGTAVRLAPSLLAADFTDLRASIEVLRPLSISWLHLDIMDGHFVPNISFGPGLVKSIRPVDDALYFDCHLMISDPQEYYEEFIKAGAQNITFHQEAAGEKSEDLLKKIRRRHCNAGISIKPKTPVAAIRPLLELVDLVLVMTVEPGFGGQRLIPHTLNKVRELVLLREELGLEYLIQVDGGIDSQTAPIAVAAGADVLVAGSSVYGGKNIRQNVRVLRKSMTELS